MRFFTRWGGLATVVTAMLAAGATAAGAQGRPDVRTMTCGQARALVQQQGSVVLSTGRYTYDRFVASRRLCPSGEVGEYAWVQTRDASSCRIGYICVMDTEDWDDRFWWSHRR